MVKLNQANDGPSIADASRLFDRSLAEAFRMFVIEDAEVVALAKAALQEHERERLLRESQFPGPYIKYDWPLDLTAENLAFNFVRPVMFFIDEPIPEASVEIQRLSIVIVDRLLALKGHLVGG